MKLGREARNEENRIGQAWKAGSIQVIGEDVFGNTRVFELPDGNFQCEYCFNIVRIDKRGFAACENCGMIYNDHGQIDQKMSKREKKRRLKRFKYEIEHKD